VLKTKFDVQCYKRFVTVTTALDKQQVALR